MDRADRRRQILAQGRLRTEDARRQRHPDRGGRWAEGFSRDDRLGVSADRGADLHRTPDPQQPGVRILEGSQGDPACHQGDLPGRECRHGAAPARRVRRRMGQALPGDRPGLAPRLGARRSVLRIRSWRPQDDLHHQRGRSFAPQLTQDHQDPWQLSKRRCGVEAALPRRHR